mmetsp:Transcript_21404/g.51055  ORF Transcript_21404/g.51055 Transcript_21404/m.51055 type:complete len:223 (+) Transcript_21404:1932-2600(+)
MDGESGPWVGGPFPSSPIRRLEWSAAPASRRRTLRRATAWCTSSTRCYFRTRLRFPAPCQQCLRFYPATALCSWWKPLFLLNAGTDSVPISLATARSLCLPLQTPHLLHFCERSARMPTYFSPGMTLWASSCITWLLDRPGSQTSNTDVRSKPFGARACRSPSPATAPSASEAHVSRWRACRPATAWSTLWTLCSFPHTRLWSMRWSATALQSSWRLWAPPT